MRQFKFIVTINEGRDEFWEEIQDYNIYVLGKIIEELLNGSIGETSVELIEYKKGNKCLN